MATSNLMWGLLQGPLSDATPNPLSERLVGPIATQQLFDGSSPARTIAAGMKVFTVTNPQISGGNVYIGPVGSTAAGYFTLEIKPGDPAAVLEQQPQGLGTWHIEVAALGIAVISQLG